MKRITVASTITTLFVICFVIIILSDEHCDDCFSTTIMMIKFFACGLVISIGSIYYTRLYLKNERSIFNIETIPLLETNEGSADMPFSCEGKVTPAEGGVIKSPYTGLPCVYFHSITERKEGSGKHSRWVLVENLVYMVPFFVTDERGKLRVDPANMDSDFSGHKIGKLDRMLPDPENSEIDCIPVLKHQMIDGSLAGSLLGMPLPLGNLRRSEYILPPDTSIFVYGYLTRRGDELILHEYPRHPLIISRKTKEAYVEEFYKGNNLVYMVHLLTAAGFVVSLYSINYFLNLPETVLFGILTAGIMIITGSSLFTMYNRLITLTQRAKFALNDIDIELKRRAELIPKIAELVKVYAEYEKELLGFIARAREHMVFLKDLPEGSGIDINPLVAIIESYPDLKASENFNSLMNSLVDTEERIVYARAFYNRTVRKLNTLVRQFPFIIISEIFNIREMEYVSVVAEDRVTPEVNLTTPSAT